MKPLRAHLITAAAFIYYWADRGRGGGAGGLVGAGPWEAEGEEKLLQLCSFSREMLNLCVASLSWIIEERAVCSRADRLPACTWGFPTRSPAQSHTHNALWHQQYRDSSPIGSGCFSWLSEVLLTSFSRTWAEFAGCAYTRLNDIVAWVICEHKIYIFLSWVKVKLGRYNSLPKNAIMHSFCGVCLNYFCVFANNTEVSVKIKREKNKQTNKNHLFNLNLEWYAAHLPPSSWACILSAG